MSDTVWNVSILIKLVGLRKHHGQGWQYVLDLIVLSQTSSKICCVL